ncbi:MAG: DNA-deoxyinosine glycosylase [Xanthomonadales bacterium]|jgi:hypoxanthine-DNA glycosylase|nr:DNA-deoxyinosine glycosylase [Xanthomonadales bacterium]
MSRTHGFPPVTRPDAKILILGSMPSRESLARQQYYAHPRNAFWPILCSLFSITATKYHERSQAVAERGVAIWDVLHDCVRPGSLDSDIDEKTAVTNDFQAFFNGHRQIAGVCFNGAKAESIYVKRVLPGLDDAAAKISRNRLPSTSPAHAGMNFEQKKAAWRSVLKAVLE